MVEIASSKASLVDDLQNKNQELMKRIDYCQEETKVLDKLHRQKVNEVEKLSLRVAEMEELLLSSGLNQANAVKDYQRQLHQLQDEKRALERELARVKLTANRVATTVVNGWRASNDNKVMPVKHWLEERRLLQSEMEQLRKKLVAMEKTSKTEAILKERAQMRLKVLEESTMLSSTLSKSSQARRPGSNNGSANVLIRHETFKSITSSKIISYNQFSSSTASSLDENLQEEQSSNGGKLLMCCSSVDHSQKNRESCPEPCNTSENDDTGSVKLNLDSSNCTDPIATVPTISYHCAEMITANKDCRTAGDCVSGYLYDLLQKEVIVLRKACQQKDCVLSDKENVIEMLEKKMCSLTRSMETESKKLRKEVATLGKEVSNLRTSASASHKSFISKQNKNIAHFQASKRGHE
ncbi:hypothetical protein KP509_38G006200 [Ceratopteris richardii]|nr:hypothetical protein KP509_38G006200 [Ceratopteris richardii]